jgi:Holliday junction resolvase RusA-like endonuclease
MKSLIVKLDIKPLTQNHKLMPIKVGRSMRLAKSKNYRTYEDKLDSELAKHFDDFRKMGFYFDFDKHALKVQWSIYVPEKEFFTKKGTISKTCIDATNTVKILEDRLAFILGVDDSQICDTNVKKIPTDLDSWCVVLEISIERRPEVVRLAFQK